jgi:hypothetical protein
MACASGLQPETVLDESAWLTIGTLNRHVQENSLYIEAAENEEIEHVNLEN